MRQFLHQGKAIRPDCPTSDGVRTEAVPTYVWRAVPIASATWVYSLTASHARTASLELEHDCPGGLVAQGQNLPRRFAPHSQPGRTPTEDPPSGHINHASRSAADEGSASAYRLVSDLRKYPTGGTHSRPGDPAAKSGRPRISESRPNVRVVRQLLGNRPSCRSRTPQADLGHERGHTLAAGECEVSPASERSVPRVAFAFRVSVANWLLPPEETRHQRHPPPTVRALGRLAAPSPDSGHHRSEG